MPLSTATLTLRYSFLLSRSAASCAAGVACWACAAAPEPRGAANDVSERPKRAPARVAASSAVRVVWLVLFMCETSWFQEHGQCGSHGEFRGGLAVRPYRHRFRGKVADSNGGGETEIRRRASQQSGRGRAEPHPRSQKRILAPAT